MLTATFASIAVYREFNIIIDGIIIPLVSSGVYWLCKYWKHFSRVGFIFQIPNLAIVVRLVILQRRTIWIHKGVIWCLVI